MARPDPAPAAPVTRGPSVTVGAPTASLAGLTALSAAPNPLDHAFSPDRHDYVVRCADDQTITLSGTVAPGVRLRAVALGPGAPPPALLTASFTQVLRAPATTTVRLELAPADDPTGPTDTYRVRCLPPSFPEYTVTVSGTPQASHYLVTWGTYLVLFDAEGTPVWWLDQAPRRPIDAKVIDGRLVSTESGGDHYTFRDWDGTVVRTVGHVLDHHDLQRLPDGRLVGFEYVTSDRGFEEEARFVALDEDDDETWVWRTEDHIDPSERVPAAYKSDNFAHVNAVEPDGDGGVVWSARSLDAIYAVDLATDEIRWKLGGTDRPESLRVSDGTRILDPAEVVNLFAGQHDPRFWPDGTLSVMDNGSSDPQRRPRLIRFELDLDARLATAVETVTDPRAAYSGGTGSARRLSGGNWVATWGLPQVNRYITELTPAGEPVLTIHGVATYRVVPFEAGDLEPDELRSGMDAMAGSPTGLTGTVLDAVDGAPVAGAGIALLHLADTSLAGAATAGADGGFSVPVPPGAYLAYLLDATGAHRSGFHGPPSTVTVGAGAPTDLVATMDPRRGTIAGTVTEDGTGAPVPGAWAVALDPVTGAPRSGVTADAAGRYATDPLPVGDYRVVLLDPAGAHAPRFHGGSADAAGATPAPVSEGGSTVADAALPPQPVEPGGSSLDGRVTDERTGAGLPGVWVLALTASRYSLAGTAVTDDAGGYALDLAAGGYKLVVVDPSGRRAAEWHEDRPYHAIAEADTAHAPATVDASLTDSGGRIVGDVRDRASGDALPGTWIVAIGPAGIAGGAVAAGDGSFEIEGLAPGTYRVTFVDPSGVRRQQYWDGADAYDDATTVPVGAGTTIEVSALLGP
ncbi:MAG: carboxypeptidase regulatory-like domain-containing protein [Microthrixaceae bacterium]|nr:carboxypeptidase regulatory-like domain-containing protein [Microthrixaceae bacterium]